MRVVVGEARDEGEDDDEEEARRRGGPGPALTLPLCLPALLDRPGHALQHVGTPHLSSPSFCPAPAPPPPTPLPLLAAPLRPHQHLAPRASLHTQGCMPPSSHRRTHWTDAPCPRRSTAQRTTSSSSRRPSPSPSSVSTLVPSTLYPCQRAQHLSHPQAPTFDALGLKEDLLRGIYAYGAAPSPLSLSSSVHCEADMFYARESRTGFEKPSAIQQRAILPVIKGRDVIAQVRPLPLSPPLALHSSL